MFLRIEQFLFLLLTNIETVKKKKKEKYLKNKFYHTASIGITE